ncbi:ribosomal protein S18-alanine N-acetyltransferase [Myxococcota bacterium]|nr:ribosomal protein S18-alanine N-acetyltransferase [Myxococcota bacterium]MBU1537248.1 ribosomal protein S18-alanine N-acetyltransferase [Myxococcota bacterium]
MSSHEIIPLDRGHLNEILDIEVLSFGSPWTEVAFLGEFVQPHSFTYGVVSLTDHKVMAYIVFWLLEDEVHILNLAVHPAFRREGLANSLLTYLVDVSQKAMCRLVFLEVRPSNLAALRLYESFGFVKVGIRPNYYTDTSEDAHLYTLFLEDSHDY